MSRGWNRVRGIRTDCADLGSLVGTCNARRRSPRGHVTVAALYLLARINKFLACANKPGLSHTIYNEGTSPSAPKRSR